MRSAAARAPARAAGGRTARRLVERVQMQDAPELFPVRDERHILHRDGAGKADHHDVHDHRRGNGNDHRARHGEPLAHAAQRDAREPVHRPRRSAHRKARKKRRAEHASETQPAAERPAEEDIIHDADDRKAADAADRRALNVDGCRADEHPVDRDLHNAAHGGADDGEPFLSARLQDGIAHHGHADKERCDREQLQKTRPGRVAAPVDHAEHRVGEDEEPHRHRHRDERGDAQRRFRQMARRGAVAAREMPDDRRDDAQRERGDEVRRQVIERLRLAVYAVQLAGAFLHEPGGGLQPVEAERVVEQVDEREHRGAYGDRNADAQK